MNVFRLIVQALVWISQNSQIFLQPYVYIPVCDAIFARIIYLVGKGSELWRNILLENDDSSPSESRDGQTKNSLTLNDSESMKSGVSKADSALESDLAKPAERSSHVYVRPFYFRNKLSTFRIQDLITLLSDRGSKNTNIAVGKDEAGDIAAGLNSSSFWDAVKSGISSKGGIRERVGEADANLHVPWTGKETMKIPKEHDWVVAQEENLTLKTSSCDNVIVGLLTREPADTGSTQNKTNASSKNENQTPPDRVKPSPQAEGGNGSISYSGGSSGSGGDGGDGDDNRKQTLRVGGCQGSSSSDMDNEDKSEHVPKEQGRENDGDNGSHGSCNNEEDCSEFHRTDDSWRDGVQSGPQSSSSCSTMPGKSVESSTQKNDKSSGSDSAKKAAQQDLRIDVTAAKMEAHSHFLPIESQVESEEICKTESDKDLQKAFTCRRNLNSEREWQKCTDAFCQQIQYLLDHSQNCIMRVLGGCENCICYKDMLWNHVSKCILPLGRCVVARCDYIREYMRTNCLPENRKWTWALDQLFFRPTPPSTPTNEDSEEFLGGFKEVLARLEAANAQEDTVRDPVKDILIADGSLTSNCEPLRSANGWNQYHVDRPPDVQVTRGPVIQESIQAECEDCSPSAPLSVADVSVTNTCTSQTVGSDLVQELGEVIWPLNQENLGVGENGSYIEKTHWQVIHSIGGGSCGRCYLCRDLSNQSLFAIKKIPIGKFESNEIEIWGGLSGRHPNILELYGAMKYRQSGTVVIFMEYMSGGSVEEYAGQMEHNEIWAIHVLGKVVSAVDFMHFQGILHRDIKGGNVLVDETGQHVKLADFGTSIRCESFLQDNIPRGTEPFMSPEMCRSECHSFSTDIWSIMCLLYQLLAGRPPWVDSCHGSLIYRIGTAKEPPSSPPCSPEVEDLFSQGFILKPADRKTARQLLRHPAIMAVSAPDTSDFLLPTWGDTEQYSDGASSNSSFSSNVLKSIVSEMSADQQLCDDCASDLEGDDANFSDCYDDGTDDDDDDNDDDDLAETNDFQVDGLIFPSNGAWLGADLSVEQQFRSLQSDLVLSLSADELERHVLSNLVTDVSENDVNQLRDDNFDVSQVLGLNHLEIQSIDDLPPSSMPNDWSYSITDLAKIHITDNSGKWLFSIRERPTTAYGRLAEDLHDIIATRLNLNFFSLTREDGAPLNVRAEIGREEQTLRVVRAHDNDQWQEYRWRVDDRGRVEEFFDLGNN